MTIDDMSQARRMALLRVLGVGWGLMCGALLVLVLVVVGAGCGAEQAGEALDAAGVRLPLEPVTRLVGELHLHQFPAGSHAWAAFVATPVAVADVHSDQLYQLETEVTASEGACRLWRRPICSKGCDVGMYCAGTDLCRPLSPQQYVDSGALHITGSRLHDTIELKFGGGGGGYESDPPPGAALLFAGGELLRVDGGEGERRLAGALPAPALLQLRAPSPEAPFHVPLQGGLEVLWDAGNAAQVVITISASTSNGDYGNIRCVGPDSGQARVPPSLLAGLPAPPRTNRIEVERDNELILKTVTPGAGMLAHAAFSAWMNSSDP